MKKEKRCRDGITCVVLCVACTLSSIYLVCVVFGTAIPTSLYNVFHILVLYNDIIFMFNLDIVQEM